MVAGDDENKKGRTASPIPRSPKPPIDIPEPKPEIPSSDSLKRPYESDPMASTSTTSSQETLSHSLFMEALRQELSDVHSIDSPKVKRHRSRSKSKSNSPAPMLARFPTPTSLAGGTVVDPEETSRTTQSVIPARPVPIEDPVPLEMPAASDPSRPPSPSPAPTVVLQPLAADIPSDEVDKDDLPPTFITTEPMILRDCSMSFSTMSSVSSLSDMEESTGNPLELVRTGTYILNLLLSNSASKNFVNMVPLSALNYHSIIKHPMDLTTIEQKLWKGYEISQAPAGELSTRALVPSCHIHVADGYSSLQEFEDDLQLIYKNAVRFNPPDDIINKEAQLFRTLYTGLVRTCREQQSLDYCLPQELYNPSMIMLEDPGPLYLFRAHLVKEMDRKMTDNSVDLFASLHQPLFDTMYGTEPLSSEAPRFVRMYINKNRTLLDKCRDEPFSKLAIISDLQSSKAFLVSGLRVVSITARVMIAKPIGDRHEMVTVGDLDCPSAWITAACVKRLDLDVHVPARFEKGVLTKLRHEVVAYGGANSKVSPEYQQLFLDALGVKLPGLLVQSARSAVSVPTGPVITIDSDTPVSAAATVVPDESLSLSSVPSDKLSTSATDSTTMSALSHGVSESTIPPVFPPSTSPMLEPKLDADEPLLKKPKLEEIEPVFSLSNPIPAPDFDTRSPVPDGGTFSETLLQERIKEEPDSSLAISSSVLAADEKTLTSVLDRSPQVSSSSTIGPESVPEQKLDSTESEQPEASEESSGKRILSKREQEILRDLKIAAEEKHVPYIDWETIMPTLTMDSAQGLFKRIYHVKGDSGLVVQNFKEMDKESFEQRVREVACLLRLRGLEGVGQIQAVIDDGKDRLVGLSMTKYAHTLKAYATNARRHPSPWQKLSLIRDMTAAISEIHRSGLAHRDLSEVNIMIDEDPVRKLADNTPRPVVRVIDFGKSVFVRPDDVKRWSVREVVSDEELELLPMVVLNPDHGYKLYRSIMTLPRTKFDHTPLDPVDPLAEDVYSLGVLIWRTFSGKSPWNGAIEDDLKMIRYLVKSDEQIKFQLEREIIGKKSRELLLKCLTANPANRWTAQQLKNWLDRPDVSTELVKEFEALGGGRKRVRKNLD
ncbi:hypothetical protein BGX31_003461 [Mortierella sp. GBA43]|nr:hypothetical protein BGX31_003461 [Mortierella sp. GBA43]